MESEGKNFDFSSLRINRGKLASRKSPKRVLILIVILVIIFILLILLSPNFLPFFSTEISTAEVVPMTTSEAATVLTSSGYVVARTKAEIAPKSVGRIAWINLEEGQIVKKGELVAKLENQELQAQRDRIVPELMNAKKDVTRRQELFAKGIIARQSLDNAETKLNVLKAQLRNMEELIKNTQIYSPINGVVTEKKAFLGETVTPQGFGGAGSVGATIAVIVDLDSLEVETDINEQILEKLVTGMPAEVILDAYPDHPYKARLRKIVPTADRQKGTITIRVEFLNKDDKVLPEMSCKINFMNPEIYEDGIERIRIIVPDSSLVEYEGGKGVFVVEQDRVRFQPVTLGNVYDHQIEIRDGLVGGEQVVVDAEKLNLKNGDKIELKDHRE